ncbi:hypothetical protein PTTG_25795 [Puccinia triticina 1-1 BBBD Race 1]|uniref:Uncharacterized protein n=1 Tax=Puccinia triticina (isolate 1-1 / race 1 (BBBD)) TaxID=630390 RepID=A0A180H0S1_PUCT1|nr:hypothetical protein PTTG_25795 [Puccinia triticina 1-1 BBBD Race 1]
MDQAPALPADGAMYTPAEIEGMTVDQHLFVLAHPAFWKTAPDNESDDDKKEPPLPNAPGAQQNDGLPPGAFPGNKAQDAATAAATKQIRKLKVKADPMEVDQTPAYVKRYHSAVMSDHLNTNLGNVFQGWNYKNCPYYEGSLGKAYADYEDSIALETAPEDWTSFTNWLIGLNPISVSQQVIDEEYDALAQLPNESCQWFYNQFCKWQSRAKNYNFPYHGATGFVSRLNKALNREMVTLMNTEEQRGTPMMFAQIVVAALDEDRLY